MGRFDGWQYPINDGERGGKTVRLTTVKGQQKRGAHLNGLSSRDSSRETVRGRGDSGPEGRAQHLETENALLRKTLLTVGHELRTPLASIVAYNDLLARNAGENLSSTEIERLEIIRRNAMVLDLLINDLVNMARLETNSLPIKPTRFEACTMVQEVCQTVQPFFDTKDQTLVPSLPDEDIWVFGDQGRLQQVIINLLTNASKFSPGSSRVDLSAEVSGSNLIVQVVDQGVGMDSNESDHMFDSFFTARPECESEAEGLGLGLYISRNIIEAHNGQMAASSEKGEGTTIGFSVPLDISESSHVISPGNFQPTHLL